MLSDSVAKHVRDLGEPLPAVRASVYVGRVRIKFGFGSKNFGAVGARVGLADHEVCRGSIRVNLLLVAGQMRLIGKTA